MINNQEFLYFKEALAEAKEHATKFGLIKSGLFEYDICDLEATIKYKDFCKALEKVENLIPQAKKNKKIKKTFELYMIKTEIYINTKRFQEALILLSDLQRKSESFGNYFIARLLYLSSLSKLGILQTAKTRESQINKENRKSSQNNDDEKIPTTSIDKIINDDSFEIQNELKKAAKMFLNELRLPEAKQCLYLLSRLQRNNRDNSKRFASLYLKINKVQNFCKMNLERLSKGNQIAKNFFKFILRIKNLPVSYTHLTLPTTPYV